MFSKLKTKGTKEPSIETILHWLFNCNQNWRLPWVSSITLWTTSPDHYIPYPFSDLAMLVCYRGSLHIATKYTQFHSKMVTVYTRITNSGNVHDKTWLVPLGISPTDSKVRTTVHDDCLGIAEFIKDLNGSMGWWLLQITDKILAFLGQRLISSLYKVNRNLKK